MDRTVGKLTPTTPSSCLNHSKRVARPLTRLTFTAQRVNSMPEFDNNNVSPAQSGRAVYINQSF